MKTLIVVDMQNDFLSPDGGLYIGHDTTELKRRVGKFMEEFDGRVVCTMDQHEPNACEFRFFPPHCVGGTVGANLVKEVYNARVNNKELAGKASYTGDDVLHTLAPFDSEFHVVGVCTHICVHDIVANLVNHCKNEHDFIPKVVIHKDMVDDFKPDMAAFALERLMKLYGVEVV